MNSGMMFFYGTVLAVLVWLVVRLVRKMIALVHWHREKRPRLRYYRGTLILPLVIWALPLLFFLPRSEPVPIVQAGELITVQGTISDYRTEFKGTGRYGGYRYVDGFYLNGESVYYDMPGTSFAPDEFAELVGLYPVTVEYGINAEGRRQVYALTAWNGTELLSYGTSANGFWQSELFLPAALIGLMLWGVGWILGFPACLYLDGTDEKAAKAADMWKKVRFTFVGYAAIFFLILISPWFPDSDRDLHTISTPVNLDGVVQVHLPGEWKEAGEGWYYNQLDVSIRMYVYDLGTPQEVGLTQEEWYEDYFTSLGAFLLETFLEPGTKPLFSGEEPLQLFDGQAGRLALGQGKSTGGTWNWFAAAAFPEEGAAMVFQASSWDLEPEELEAYARENVLPVIPYLEFTFMRPCKP